MKQRRWSPALLVVTTNRTRDNGHKLKAVKFYLIIRNCEISQILKQFVQRGHEVPIYSVQNASPDTSLSNLF